MSKMMRISVVCGMFVLLVFTASVYADNDARDYIPLPPGTMLVATYYNYISATDYYSHGNKISSDTNLDANIGVIRPVYFTKIGPFIIDPQAIIPFGAQSLDGQGVGGVEIKSSGLADPILAATLWFLNNPESKTWLGFTPFITLPLGEYDSSKGINMGSNRYAFKTELGFVKGFGDFFLDLTANVEFYTDNDDYTSSNLTLKQDPIYTLEGHLSYNFNPSFFVSADYFYHNGGETTVAELNQDDRKDDHIAGCTLGFMLSPSYQLLFKYKQDLEVENGLKTSTFGVRLAYFF